MTFQSWREFLGSLIQNTQERHRIAENLNVHPLTLSRWVHGQSKPREENLRALVDILPRHRQELLPLLLQEFPELYEVPPPVTISEIDIPSDFYAHIFEVLTTSPPFLRSNSLHVLILEKMVSWFDSQQHGISIYIAQCIPPEPRASVFSLLKKTGRGTGYWKQEAEDYIQFLGAETQAGYSVATGRPCITQSKEEQAMLFPKHNHSYLESMASFPIMRADGLAGSINILSSQKGLFTPTHKELIQKFANILAIAFESYEFYPASQINLGIMPDLSVQQPYLDDIQNRITQLMVEAQQAGQHLTRQEAETQVYKETENILLNLSSPPAAI